MEKHFPTHVACKRRLLFVTELSETRNRFPRSYFERNECDSKIPFHCIVVFQLLILKTIRIKMEGKTLDSKKKNIYIYSGFNQQVNVIETQRRGGSFRRIIIIHEILELILRVIRINELFSYSSVRILMKMKRWIYYPKIDIRFH